MTLNPATLPPNNLNNTSSKHECVKIADAVYSTQSDALNQLVPAPDYGLFMDGDGIMDNGKQ